MCSIANGVTPPRAVFVACWSCLVVKTRLQERAKVALILASYVVAPVGLIHFGQFPVGVYACVHLTFGSVA